MAALITSKKLVCQILRCSPATIRTLSLGPQRHAADKPPTGGKPADSLPKETKDSVKAGRDSSTTTDHHLPDKEYYTARKLNLVIRNLYDSPDETYNMLGEKLYGLCAQIWSGDELGSNITEYLRLGRPSGLKPRPILITCQDMRTRKQILYNFWLQEDYDTINKGRPFQITPDQPKKLRDKDYQLRKLRNDKRAKGEDCYIKGSSTGSEYLNTEYKAYTIMTYYDYEVEMRQDRLPQPSSLKQ